MKRVLLTLGLVGAALAQAGAEAVPGQAAPAFRLTDTKGKAHALSDFKGKIVVLEWTNYECPFVRKHYDAGAMQALQKKWTEKGVVWLTINSSAPGKQGHFTPAEWNEKAAAHKSASTAILLDPDGTVGKAYGAKTTPHMFVIAADGTTAYAGGIDDQPSTDAKTLAGAKNFVDAALGELTAGKVVTVTTSKPYGCGVKY